MSKYKIGDKVVLEITDKAEVMGDPWYLLSNATSIYVPYLDKAAEPLTNYTKLLEAYINDLLLANERLSNEKKDCIEQARAEGQNEAWELARKIVLKPGYSGYDLHEIFNCCGSHQALENYTYPEAAAKVAEWEKAKEIKVGDVLEDIADNNVKCVVTKPYSSNMAYLVFSDGSAGLNELDNLRKTGRHIDIDSFLKQIGEE